MYHNERIVTAKQAADRLKAETHAVLHWLRSGQMHDVKIKRDVIEREAHGKINTAQSLRDNRHKKIANG